MGNLCSMKPEPEPDGEPERASEALLEDVPPEKYHVALSTQYAGPAFSDTQLELFPHVSIAQMIS